MKLYFSLLTTLLTLLLLSCTSCNDTKSSTADEDTIPDRCEIDESTDTANGDTPEGDTYSADDDVLPDSDEPTCSDLCTYEQTVAAGFPLSDGQGGLTFCRPGIDSPTELDPQCVKNIWHWVNWQRYIDPETEECYPWPCVHEGIHAEPMDHPCDRVLTSGIFSADVATAWDLKIRDGKVGMHAMAHSTETAPSHRALEYNVKTDAYRTVGYAPGAVGYDHGRFVFSTTSQHVLVHDEETFRFYVISAQEQGNGQYRYELIYTAPDHREYFARVPFVGKKWVVLQMQHKDTKKRRILYSRADEWNWREYDAFRLYEGNIVGDRMTYINDDREIYVCDLSEHPAGKEDCIRTDREGDFSYAPRLDEENSELLYYFSTTGAHITRVEVKKSGEKQYTELPVKPSEEEPIAFPPAQIKGDTILYLEGFTNGQRTDYKACFYRLDEQKSYCPHTIIREGAKRYDMGFNSWDGKYQIWKGPAGPFAAFRDISCYCEKEGVCPFEGEQ